MANMKVKVPVASLIASVEKAKAEAEAKFAVDTEAYVLKVADLRSQRIFALENLIIKLDFGDPEDQSYRYFADIEGWPATPPEPHLNVRKFDRDLGLLRACTDETLSISTDSDFASYL